MRVYYLTSGTYGLSNVALRRIRISRLGDLNDPFELLAMKLTDRDYRKAIEEWKTDFGTKFGLLCFSQSWKSPVLWSHYGARHKGICLGFDIANDQVIRVEYTKNRIPIRFVGDGEAQTIVENCGNTLILRCSASETGGTARFASRLIGDREVIRTQVSKSRSGGFLHDPRVSRSVSEQHVTEPAVLGSEIEQLPDLRGFLKLASRPEWLTVKLRHDE